MLRVHKAQQSISVEPVADLHIEAREPFPDDYMHNKNWAEEHIAIFRRDARAVADALHASLPGGPLDQLLREMLERKASQLVVRF